MGRLLEGVGKAVEVSDGISSSFQNRNNLNKIRELIES
jgi:hypothetical protein